MRVTLRGCRGSIPVPGPETLKYGGNTTCIEVVTDAGEVIILDAGSGIRPLGLELMAKMPVQCAIFITHTHWDHIQGLPFFVPLFVPGSRVAIHGSFDPVHNKGLGELLAQQMQYAFFPVRECELKADIRYVTLHEQQQTRVGSAVVTNLVLGHPVLNYGYKIEADGATFFFTGDYEPPVNIYHPDDEEYADYEEMLALQRAVVIDFLRGVDAIVMDAQYTDAEYAAGKTGWGHGTYSKCIAIAEAAGIPRVWLTHHDPTRTDAALDRIEAELLESRRGLGGPEIHIAREGTTITF